MAILRFDRHCLCKYNNGARGATEEPNKHARVASRRSSETEHNASLVLSVPSSEPIRCFLVPWTKGRKQMASKMVAIVF